MHLSREIKVDYIINKIDVINRPEHVSLLREAILARANLSVVGFANAFAVQLSQSDHDFFNDLVNCDFLLRDGIGLEVLMKSGRAKPGLNMNGTDFIPTLVDLASKRGFKCLLLGTEEPYLSEAAHHLASRGVDVVGQVDGFRSENHYLDFLTNYNNLDLLVILGMGMPKQEKVAAFIKENIEHNGSLVIVCGGAIIDFWGKKVKRAPQIIRKAKLEWFYRFLQEPGRLWRRYFIGALGLSYLCFKFYLKR